MGDPALKKRDVQAPRIYTTGAVAKIAGVSERMVREWMSRGHLASYCVPTSKHRRVYEDVLVKFLLEYEMRVPAEMMARFQSQKERV